jgi:hypothetical protein
MWRESIDEEWRCSLQDIVSCKTRFFADLPSLVVYLEEQGGEPPALAPNPSLSKWVRIDLPQSIDPVKEEDNYTG